MAIDTIETIVCLFTIKINGWLNFSFDMIQVYERAATKIGSCILKHMWKYTNTQIRNASLESSRP